MFLERLPGGLHVYRVTRNLCPVFSAIGTPHHSPCLLWVTAACSPHLLPVYHQQTGWGSLAAVKYVGKPPQIKCFPGIEINIRLVQGGHSIPDILPSPHIRQFGLWEITAAPGVKNEGSEPVHVEHGSPWRELNLPPFHYSARQLICEESVWLSLRGFRCIMTTVFILWWEWEALNEIHKLHIPIPILVDSWYTVIFWKHSLFRGHRQYNNKTVQHCAVPDSMLIKQYNNKDKIIIIKIIKASTYLVKSSWLK